MATIKPSKLFPAQVTPKTTRVDLSAPPPSTLQPVRSTRCICGIRRAIEIASSSLSQSGSRSSNIFEVREPKPADIMLSPVSSSRTNDLPRSTVSIRPLSVGRVLELRRAVNCIVLSKVFTLPNAVTETRASASFQPGRPFAASSAKHRASPADRIRCRACAISCFASALPAASATGSGLSPQEVTSPVRRFTV